MRGMGLAGVTRGNRFKPTTTISDEGLSRPLDLVERTFRAPAPNRLWVADLTYVKTHAGWVYVAFIDDVFSRFVVGWAVSPVNDRHLTTQALEMALKRRCPESGLLHHSDRGSPYASADYQTILTMHGITCSMSRRGNCYDNAVMEALFSSVKAELRERVRQPRRREEGELFTYIEVFYNQRRRHSTLGQISPAAYERRADRAITTVAGAYGGIVPLTVAGDRPS